MEKETEQELIKRMIGFQKEEITSSIIYQKLAAKEKNPHNREILQRIAEDERRHYATLRGYTHQDVSPNRVGCIPNTRVWNTLPRWRGMSSTMKKSLLK